MQAKSISPNLLVEDVSQSVAFYTKKLNFSYIMGVDADKQLYLQYDPDHALAFAIVGNGAVQIMFQQIENASDDLNITLKGDTQINNQLLYIEIEEVDAFYDALKDTVEIVNEPRHTFYGMKEFYIRDNNQNIVGFAEKLV